MASGVAVNPAVMETYNQIKMKHEHKYAIFSMNDDLTEIQVLKKSAKNATYDSFLEELPADDCRYAVYDFDFQAEGGQRNKLAFFVWAPDSAKIKKKMIYASSKDALRKQLVGIGVEVQSTDFDEVEHSAVLEKIGRK